MITRNNNNNNNNNSSNNNNECSSLDNKIQTTSVRAVALEYTSSARIAVNHRFVDTFVYAVFYPPLTSVHSPIHHRTHCNAFHRTPLYHPRSITPSLTLIKTSHGCTTKDIVR